MPEAVREPASLSEDRGPTELDREDVQQEDPRCECRRADTGDAERDHRPIDGGTASHRGKDSKWDPDQEREGEREPGELERVTQLPDDLLTDWLSTDDRGAEVKVQRATQPLEVLDDERLIKVILVTDCGDRRWRCFARTEQQLYGVARSQVEQGEDQERHRKQH